LGFQIGSVCFELPAGEVAGSSAGEFLFPIALGRPERGMTDRRLLPKLRTGCSTFFSGLPCSNLGDLFDRVGEAGICHSAGGRRQLPDQRSPVGLWQDRVADSLILDAILRTTLRVLNR
jgi:hypothetical protein